MYSIELQKRGLQHALFLITTEERHRTAEQMDKNVSAELPVPESLQLFETKSLLKFACGEKATDDEEFFELSQGL